MTAVRCLEKKKCFEGGFERVQRGFLLDRNGEVVPCTGNRDQRKSPALRLGIVNMVLNVHRNHQAY